MQPRVRPPPAPPTLVVWQPIPSTYWNYPPHTHWLGPHQHLGSWMQAHIFFMVWQKPRSHIQISFLALPVRIWRWNFDEQRRERVGKPGPEKRKVSRGVHVTNTIIALGLPHHIVFAMLTQLTLSGLAPHTDNRSRR